MSKPSPGPSTARPRGARREQLPLGFEEAPGPTRRARPGRERKIAPTTPASVRLPLEAPSEPVVVVPAARSAGAAQLEASGEPSPRAGKGRPARSKETAATLGAKQREISVAEFFTKNRHLLGFDNPSKALLTAVKEAVDNALDACEEAGILPEIRVEIEALSETRFRLTVQDNGPGIVRTQVPRIFGKLLYGSKFHRLRQSRGQQGIGISAAGMYGQLTTGKAMRIISRTGRGRAAHEFQVQIDTRRNEPKILLDREIEWDHERGTRVELELEGLYRQGRRSVDDYLAQTAVANPHATVHYRTPKGESLTYERQSQELPSEAQEIKPHPHGLELGMLMHLLHDTRSRNLRGALLTDFSRVSPKVADEILVKAGISPSASPTRIASREAERLYQAIQQVKIMSPPTSCLSPIGEEVILKGLQARFPADFHAAVTRPPAVYRGNPFQIEAGLAYGGALPAEELADLYRFANRVPLLYQQGGCAVTKAAVAIAWKGYGLSQSRGSLPAAPLVLFVHIASVWVPFTSESKEAIASYPEIVKEIRLALQDCGRKLGGYLRRRQRVTDEHKKRSYIDRFLPHIGDALKDILKLSDPQRESAIANLRDILEKSRKL